MKKFVVVVLLSVLCLPVALFAAEKSEVKEVPFVEGQLPPSAEQGKAWCLVTIPPVFKTVTKQVCTRPETTYIEDTPAEYQVVQEKALTEPSRSEMQKVSCAEDKVKVNKGEELVACYQVVASQAREVVIPKIVMVKPAGKKEVKVPAKYDTVTEQELVSTAKMVWRQVSLTDCKVKK